MRRAIPYPCSGPSACKVFSTIKASVPCQTSFLSPIGFSRSSYGMPIPICFSSYGNAIEETSDPAILFPEFVIFFEESRQRWAAAQWVGLLIARGLVSRGPRGGSNPGSLDDDALVPGIWGFRARNGGRIGVRKRSRGGKRGRSGLDWASSRRSNVAGGNGQEIRGLRGPFGRKPNEPAFG